MTRKTAARWRLVAMALAMAASAGAADFMFGVYNVPNDPDAYAWVKAQGFRYVQNYFNPYGENGAGLMVRQLELAQEHGLRVLFRLTSGDVMKRDTREEDILAMVRRFKDHPALGAWYLYDEPAGDDLLDLLPRLYRRIKEEAPDIPVALLLAHDRTWRDFTGPCDWLMGDVYPVRDEPFPEAPLQYYTNFLRGLAAAGKPVIAVAQLMNWRDFPNHNRGLDRSTFRFPNAAEMRFFAFAPLALGCSGGVMWYGYRYAAPMPGGAAFVEESAPVFAELAAFAERVEFDRAPTVFTWAAESQFPMALYEGREGEQYLVIANEWPAPRRFARWLEDRLEGEFSLTPWGGTRAVTATIEKDRVKIEERIEPWEILIFELHPEQ